MSNVNSNTNNNNGQFDAAKEQQQSDSQLGHIQKASQSLHQQNQNVDYQLDDSAEHHLQTQAKQQQLSQQNQQQQAHNSAIARQHQQAMVASSQSQYLLSSNNNNNNTAQLLASSKPQQQRQLQQVMVQSFNSQQSNQQFQNHNSGFQINSNHHLYQAGIQHQQQLPPRHLFHRKTPSIGDDQSKVQASVIMQDGTHQSLDQEQQRRQLSLAQNNHSNSQDELRLRRKSEQLGLTSDVGLENLNLEFEAMLMNDGGQNISSGKNMNQFAQMYPKLVKPQNVDAMFLGQQQILNPADRPASVTKDELTGEVLYRRSNPLPQNHPNKDNLHTVYNRSEDNIYEEIDMMTMTRLQAEYPVDSLSLHSDNWKKKNSKKFLGASFTRWFSTRKKSSTSQNSDQEDSPYTDSKVTKKPRMISLPETIPENLTPEKLKRRLIVGSIVDSENSYTSSLYRMIFEFKRPLEEADPPILSPSKIGIIFYQLDQLLQFHKLFGLALSQHIQEWDQKEMLGVVFTSNFSKTMVFDIYSGFINNFTNAMETAKRMSIKSKAFSQFIEDRSISSPDRLSFFASMVKPVQRLPQFILLLSDLLKHTPFNHPDRMPLQRALTELESLADRLNERRRDAERHFAVKQLLKDHLNESNTYSQRFLIRQDEICLLEMDSSTNTVAKSKSRKLYLLNDMLICVSLPSNRLKFAVPLCDITVVESVAPAAVGNMMTQANYKSVNDVNATSSPQNCTIERMECDYQSLVHDLELMMRISALVASLKFQYNGLNPTVPEQICMGIREEIRKKEFQMTMIDRSCLQLRLHSKNHKDVLVVQFVNPDSKRSWLIDIRLTRLALDRANNPGWENVNDNVQSHQASLSIIGQRVPLFVKSLAIFKSEQSHLTCALHYYMRQAPFIGENPTGVLWICNVNVNASSLGALSTNGSEVSLIHSYELSESHVTCLESVGSTLWIGLRQGRIIVIDANSPGEWRQFASLDVQSEVKCLKYFGHFVYVGLINGVVAVFDAINYDKPLLISLSQSPVTCLLPINDEIFACSHNKIWRIKETSIVDTLTMQTDNIIPLEEEPKPNLLAHCGNGIWVSLIDSAIIKLFHAETLNHLVDVDIGVSIRRVLNDINETVKVVVTSMMATRGLLWIGTNVGMIATLSLPRLKGVPLVSGSINIALHRFLGPVNILINLSAGSECIPQLPFSQRQTQTMPKPYVKNEEAEAIYGQYADLMNVEYYISSGKKPSSDAMADRLAWEFPNMNISTMNVSDDSGSTASSGAIYQDGVPRGMKAVPNKAVVSNAMANAIYQESMQSEHLKQQSQQLQQDLTNQPHMSTIEQDAGSTDYGSHSGRTMNKIYDQPAQLLQHQQQQVINQAKASNVQDGSMINNMPVHVNQSAKLYGTTSKAQQFNKTVLVLAGGNGYQRMAPGDNKPFGEHAHCIIWEYKA